jgi:hypothetical protein
VSDWYRWDGDDLILSLKIQPKASRDELAEPLGDALKVRITAPPVDGGQERRDPGERRHRPKQTPTHHKTATTSKNAFPNLKLQCLSATLSSIIGRHKTRTK